MSSPVCGRVLRAVSSGGAGSSTRRCLFGVVDHEELQQDYSLLMRAELEDASRRWSFDFSANKPLVGGDFEWVELPAFRVPFLYRDRSVGTVPCLKRLEPLPDLDKEGALKTPEICEENTQSTERHILKRKQTNITDFYQTKRRVITTRKSGQ